MAKQLYDYWFVQFDFPDENGKPYKSSGGKMVWNEKLKREIPEGWEVSQLGNICSFRNGINYAKDEVGSPYSIVNVRNISSTSIILDSEDFDVITIPSSKAQNYMLTEKDIVIARSGCPGATRLLQTPNSTLYCGFIICCTPFVGNLRIYLTFLLKSLEGSSATTSGGSILQNVSQETLKSLLVTIPPMTLLVHFDKFLNDIIEQLYSNSKTIKELTKLRDSLLPLLMNGQVSVNYDLASIISQLHNVKKANFANHRGRHVTKFVYICAKEERAREKGSGVLPKKPRTFSRKSCDFPHKLRSFLPFGHRAFAASTARNRPSPSTAPHRPTTGDTRLIYDIGRTPL